MPTINVPAIETGDEGNAELWNSRYAAIVDLLNGKLDAANLVDGAVTAPKIGTSAVTWPKIDSSVIDEGSNAEGNWIEFGNGFVLAFRDVNIEVSGSVQNFSYPIDLSEVYGGSITGRDGALSPDGGSGFNSRYRAFVSTVLSTYPSGWRARLDNSSVSWTSSLSEYEARLTVFGRKA